jgi:hypothetical protein
MAENNEFIREVDEEYRRDRIAQIWKRYNGVIVGLAVLLVVAVGGFRYWQYAERARAEAAGARFQEALELAGDGKGEEAERALDALARDVDGGYDVLARFRLAAEKAKANAEEGAKAFDALAGDAALPPVLQDWGRLRAATLRLDADPAAAQPVLERLAQPTNPWRHTARELLVVMALKRGDYDAAGRWVDQMAADREAPASQRPRLETYSALVAAGPVQPTQ